jgi:signal transduction histidine kinase
VGVEATAAYLGVLAALRRAMAGAGIGVLAALALLGLAFTRIASARAALEERLRRAETLAGLGQMTAMMAHEIRNPLGIIRGSAETLAETHGLADDPVYRFIPEEVDRLHQTLSAYLDFANPAPGTGRTDAGASLRRTLDLVAGEFGRKGIALDTDLAAGEHPVALAARDLEQACLNLLLNARDALGEGGTVRVGLERAGNRVRITVADDGPGMDEATRRRAFEPFVTDKEKGSGLGLAVVRRAVEGAGGTATLESAPGRGTVVRLTLPRAEEEA